MKTSIRLETTALIKYYLTVIPKKIRSAIATFSFISVLKGAKTIKMSRFAVYDDEDVKAFKTKIRAKRTQESTDFAINILNQYCESQCIAFVEHDLSPSTLNNLLSRFYLCISNKKGEYYKISVQEIE